MFTGIIEEIGTIKNIRKGTSSIALTIEGKKIFEDIHIGDSIAVNGVCLTVTSFSNTTFTVDVMPETVGMTSLKDKTIGSKVNLERAMSVNSRFGGHIVSGHVDGLGTIKGIVKEDNSIVFTIATDAAILNYIVYKGSITVDGASLTVSEVKEDSFSISIIPHTLSNTILKEAKEGTIVNLETDVVGKYVYKFLSQGEADKSKKKTGLTKDFLMEKGFF